MLIPLLLLLSVYFANTPGEPPVETVRPVESSLPYFCLPAFYHTHKDVSTGSNVNGAFGLYSLDGTPTIDGGFELQGMAYGANINAAGYHVPTGNVWFVETAGNAQTLVRSTAPGSYDPPIDIGLAAALNGSNVNIGAFGDDNLFYVKAASVPTVVVIDVTASPPAATYLSQDPSTDFFAKDWAYESSSGQFWGVHGGTLYSYDPGANSSAVYPITGLRPEDGPVYGAAWAAADGYVYVANSNSGNLYRLNTTYKEAHFVIRGPANTSAYDGFSCPTAPPPVPVVCAHRDSLCVASTDPVTLDVIQNDVASGVAPYSGFGIDPPAYTTLEAPQFGTVSYDGNGSITYTPNGAPQPDVFKYQICGTPTVDGQQICDYSYVKILTGPAPTFSLTDTYCAGDATDPLPGISNNGISGSWNPGTIDNTASGTYVFTPGGPECAGTYTLNVTIEQPVDPVFTLTDTYCAGDATDPLPGTSDNGIGGTWNPTAIDNTSSGSYFFTPGPAECATPFQLDVTITPPTTPTFSFQSTYCAGATTDALPATSDEGITGTWDATTIDNTASATYTFTPDAGECAVSTTETVTITDPVDPTFSVQTTYCAGATTDALPSTSDNGIAGSWSPTAIDNSASGSYIFTSDAGECDAYLADRPSVGDNYYRLRQIDADGDETRAAVVRLDWRAVGALAAFPNPTGDWLTITLPAAGTAELRVFSADGQLRLHRAVAARATNHYRLDCQDLPPGLYYLVAGERSTSFAKY